MSGNSRTSAFLLMGRGKTAVRLLMSCVRRFGLAVLVVPALVVSVVVVLHLLDRPARTFRYTGDYGPSSMVVLDFETSSVRSREEAYRSQLYDARDMVDPSPGPMYSRGRPEALVASPSDSSLVGQLVLLGPGFFPKCDDPGTNGILLADEPESEAIEMDASELHVYGASGGPYDITFATTLNQQDDILIDHMPDSLNLTIYSRGRGTHTYFVSALSHASRDELAPYARSFSDELMYGLRAEILDFGEAYLFDEAQISPGRLRFYLEHRMVSPVQLKVGRCVGRPARDPDSPIPMVLVNTEAGWAPPIGPHAGYVRGVGSRGALNIDTPIARFEGFGVSGSVDLEFTSEEVRASDQVTVEFRDVGRFQVISPGPNSYLVLRGEAEAFRIAGRNVLPSNWQALSTDWKTVLLAMAGGLGVVALRWVLSGAGTGRRDEGR